MWYFVQIFTKGMNILKPRLEYINMDQTKSHNSIWTRKCNLLKCNNFLNFCKKVQLFAFSQRTLLKLNETSQAVNLTILHENFKVLLLENVSKVHRGRRLAIKDFVTKNFNIFVEYHILVKIYQLCLATEFWPTLACSN